MRVSSGQLRRPTTRAFILLGCVLVVTGCAEQQDGGQLCPVLCPEQNIPTRDTVIADIGASATVGAYPVRGSASTLLLADRGDSLDTRLVIRFDSIPSRYRKSASDTSTLPITFVDSAELRLRLDTTGKKATKPVTVSLYDVDTTAADSSNAALVALFRADRLIGSATFDTAALKDTTLGIKLDTAFLRTRILARQRIRIGVQLSSAESAQLKVFSSITELGPQVVFDPSPDTATHVGSYRTVSLTPSDNDALARDLRDFTLIVQGTPSAASLPGVVSVGGLPAHRGYLRFELPESIVDSGTVVRATLSLTQIATLAFDANETITLYAHASLASGIVTAPDKAALLIGGVVDSVRVTAGSTGVVELELVRLFRRWKGTKPADQPRVLILRTSTEGVSPIRLQFQDGSSAAGVTPRLRLTYVPRVDFGLP